MLKPLQCSILYVPPQRLRRPAMIVILQEWNLYRPTKSKERYNHYKLLKDVLHNPTHLALGEQEKLRCGQFLKSAVAQTGNLQTYVTAGSLERFRADGTPGPVAWQSTIDCRDKALRSFVPFSLCGAAGRQQPFHLKGRAPFSPFLKNIAFSTADGRWPWKNNGIGTVIINKKRSLKYS